MEVQENKLLCEHLYHSYDVESDKGTLVKQYDIVLNNNVYCFKVRHLLPSGNINYAREDMMSKNRFKPLQFMNEDLFIHKVKNNIYMNNPKDIRVFIKSNPDKLFSFDKVNSGFRFVVGYLSYCQLVIGLKYNIDITGRIDFCELIHTNINSFSENTYSLVYFK